MSVAIRDIGKNKYGESVRAFTLDNGVLRAVLLDHGATLQSLWVPNAQGGVTDVVLGYDSVEEYDENGGFVGATIGRMGNRVGGAELELGGVTYKLAANDGQNSLHGGLRGFDKHVWQAEAGDDRLRFSRLSPHGEENYPGDLRVSVSYILDGSSLRIVYDADTDRDTVVNLTNHSYFDLSGRGLGMEQELCINAESFLELGEGTLPTGRILPVEGTPFDFRTAKAVGRDIDMADPQLALGGGYDHNFDLCSREAAVLSSADSGIRMTLITDRPGVQLYTANFLSRRSGKGGRELFPRCALCLETQLYPNALHCYGFPSPVLHRGEHMHSETALRFSLL